MNATLSFNLPEDQESFELAINAGKWYDILWELDNELRNHIKYNPTDLSNKTLDVYDEVRERIYKLMAENNLTW